MLQGELQNQNGGNTDRACRQSTNFKNRWCSTKVGISQRLKPRFRESVAIDKQEWKRKLVLRYETIHR